MNRTMPLLIAVLLGAACDERTKTPEATPQRNRLSTAVNDQPVARQRVEPDNTGMNTRDRGNTLTPMDQGNSSAETAITADIRKAMMSESSLSFTAKNAKVMTVGSRVTLRGPVASSAEKTLIEAVAKRTAGVSDVDNQLEVKP